MKKHDPGNELRERRARRERLARECAKLDPEEEKAFAEEGLERELSRWPSYCR